MKLKTESSIFQEILCIIWLLSIVAILISAKNDGWEALFLVLLLVGVVLVGGLIQFAFGLSWSSIPIISDRICAEAFHYLGDYQPSTAEIYATSVGRDYRVDLHLTLSTAELVTMFERCSDRRDGLNYFLLFEGDFPFARDTQMFYLTRAAMRQIRQYSRQIFTADNVCGYVQFDFDFTLPYHGRENPIFDRYYLLSRWDLREIRQILDASDLDLCSFFSSIGDLTLTSEDLAMYSSWLEHTPRDTFVAAIPEDEEAEEKEEQEEESNE